MITILNLAAWAWLAVAKLADKVFAKLGGQHLLEGQIAAMEAALKKSEEKEIRLLLANLTDEQKQDFIDVLKARIEKRKQGESK